MRVSLWEGDQFWEHEDKIEVKPGSNRINLELKRNLQAEREKQEERQRRAEEERKRKARGEVERKRKEAVRAGMMSADGRYSKDREGVITDSRTSLQWYVGPDRDTNWDEARKWVEGLSIAGGGWHMPSRSELRGLSQKGVRSEDPKYLPPIFKTSGRWVWSDETHGSSPAWNFRFSNGGETWPGLYLGYGSRAFAVRSRR